MTPAHQDVDEAARHSRAIDALARELGAPPGKVRLVYEHELRRVTNGAQVNDFLVVFARKGTRECLLCPRTTRMAKCKDHARCPVELWNDSSTAGETGT
jgi:hypothetical protein